MLIREDPELEEGVLLGDFDIAIPASIFVPSEGGDAEITTFEMFWDICRNYDSDCGHDPLSDKNIVGLIDKMIPVMRGYGYSYDPKSSRVILEYSINSDTVAMREISSGAQIIHDALSELDGIACGLLHSPESAGEDDSDVSAVVIRDGLIVSCAGVNDLTDEAGLEVYVETDIRYRGNGYASAAVAALCLELIKNGYTVMYKCAEDNRSSARVAEKLGFVFNGKRMSFVFRAGEILT